MCYVVVKCPFFVHFPLSWNRIPFSGERLLRLNYSLQPTSKKEYISWFHEFRAFQKRCTGSNCVNCFIFLSIFSILKGMFSIQLEYLSYWIYIVIYLLFVDLIYFLNWYWICGNWSYGILLIGKEIYLFDKAPYQFIELNYKIERNNECTIYSEMVSSSFHLYKRLIRSFHCYSRSSLSIIFHLKRSNEYYWWFT